MNLKENLWHNTQLVQPLVHHRSLLSNKCDCELMVSSLLGVVGATGLGVGAVPGNRSLLKLYLMRMRRDDDGGAVVCRANLDYGSGVGRLPRLRSHVMILWVC